MELFKAENQAANKQALEKISAEVHQVFLNNGVSTYGMNCHTECSISIGPDGKPYYQCKLICE